MGQSVTLERSHLQIRRSDDDYEVVRLVPDAGDGPQYRIKSRSEGFERMAVERDLSSNKTTARSPFINAALAPPAIARDLQARS
jgi:hypothetical protein